MFTVWGTLCTHTQEKRPQNLKTVDFFNFFNKKFTILRSLHHKEISKTEITEMSSSSLWWMTKQIMKAVINYQEIHQIPQQIKHAVSWWPVNSLWPSGATWWHRSGSTLAQEMACCLTTPSHYLNQCWLIINGILWHQFSKMCPRYQFLKWVWKIQF